MIDRKAIESLGWCARDESAWHNLAIRSPRLAILAPPLDTIPSAQGQAIYVLVERLALLMQIPCVILAKWPEEGTPGPSPVGDRILYYKKSLNPGLADRLPHRLKKLLWGSGAPHLLHYATAAAKACRLLRAETVMIEDIPIFAPVMRRILGPSTRLLLHQHANAPSSISRSRWKRVVRDLDGVIFVSESSRRTVEQRHGTVKTSTWVVYNGVDLTHYDPLRLFPERARLRSDLGIADSACVLLFVGRLLPSKGPAEAAEAFNLAGIPDAHLLIAGDFNVLHYRDDAYLERIKSAAEELGGRIHMLGNVPQERLPAWYATADVVIVPSIGPEGLPKVVTEALAMGKPVIATDRGGTWELLREGENGWLLENPQNILDTSKLLKEILKGRNRHNDIGRIILENDRSKMGEVRMSNDISEIVIIAQK